LIAGHISVPAGNRHLVALEGASYWLLWPLCRFNRHTSDLVQAFDMPLDIAGFGIGMVHCRDATAEIQLRPLLLPLRIERTPVAIYTCVLCVSAKPGLPADQQHS
jgi:hypothetical protein